MLNRWSVLFLFVGVILGYALAGRPVKAQGDPLPISVGDRITGTYLNDKSFSCVVGEIRGVYLRCDPTGPTTSIGSRRSEHWQSLESVVSITKRQE
jgi:hypothetical protein